MGDFIFGIDTGGTFTDCVVVDADGRIVTAKAPSTPRRLLPGRARLARPRRGASSASTPRRSSAGPRRLALGTTVGTNALLQRRGAKVGLITTKGHRDVIHIMRGARGVPGLASEKVLHFPESNKPDPPIVPKTLIAEVSERVDCKGQVVVELNEDEAAAAIRRLVAKGVEAIAICFLWSFKQPEHERRVKAMVERHRARRLRLLLGRPGAALGRVRADGGHRDQRVPRPGHRRLHGARRQPRRPARASRTPVQVMQCGGGVVPAAEAARRAFLTLDSGPVAGVLASQYLGGVLGQKHVIATDMGGTSFDVGLVHDGRPVASYQSVVNQYEYFVPRIDIRSIGSGGGSIVWVDETSGSLRVGPLSAGAEPGPGVLRPRRHRADRHRRRRGPRLSRPGLLPRRPAPPRRASAARQSLEPIATAPRHGRGGDGERRRARGRAPDGRPHPEGHRAQGLRPARLRRLRLRRRGAGARRRVRARARRAVAHRPARRRLLAVVGARRGLGGPPAHLRDGRHPRRARSIPARVSERFAELERAGARAARARRRRSRARRASRARRTFATRARSTRSRCRCRPARSTTPRSPQLAADFHRRYESALRPGRGLPRGARGDRDLSRAHLRGERQAGAPAGARAAARRRPTTRGPGRAPVYWAELGRLRADAGVLGRAPRRRQRRRGARHHPGAGHDHRRAPGPVRAHRPVRQRARRPQRRSADMADIPHPSSVPGGPFDGVTFPYIPGATLSIDPEARAPHGVDGQGRSDHLRGGPPPPVDHQRGARDDDPAHLGLPGGDVRLRPELVDLHRGRRVHLLRAVPALHVGRVRRAGEVDARASKRQPGHPRGRHVPLERSLGGRGAPDGRDAAQPGVLGGQALLLDHQRAPPVRRGRHHAGQLLPQRPRRLRRGHPAPARQDRGGRRAAGRTSRRCTSAPRASRTSSRSTCAPRSPATSRRGGASPSSSSATAPPW